MNKLKLLIKENVLYNIKLFDLISYLNKLFPIVSNFASYFSNFYNKNKKIIFQLHGFKIYVETFS